MIRRGSSSKSLENEKAARLLDEAGRIIRAALAAHPEHYFTRKAYPRVFRAASKLKLNAGDYDGALRDIDESARLTDELMKLKPEDYTLKRTVWLNQMHYCETYAAMNDAPKIVEACAKTLDFNVKALAKEPDESFALYDLATSYYHLGRGHRLLGEPDRALEDGRRALEGFARLSGRSPGINDYERSLAVVEHELAEALLLKGELGPADESLRAAREKLERVVERDPAVNFYRAELARLYLTSAAASRRRNDPARAREWTEKAAALIRPLAAAGALRVADRDLLAALAADADATAANLK